MSIVDKPERPAETAHGIAVRGGWEWIEKWNGPDLGMSVRDLLFNALNDLSIRLEPEWRRLVEEAQGASEHFRDELAEAKAREDRLKGELAEARRLLRTVASDASPAMDAWDAECDAFLAAATPAESHDPRCVLDKDHKSGCKWAGMKAPPAEQAQREGAPAVWPTIHGLEQHYREVRGQVAELAKRVDALTVDSDLGGAREAKLADWHRELKGRVDTLGHEAQEDAKAWADMALTLMNRVTKLEAKPAPPPPEAAGPGHVFVGSILNRAICVGLLGCTKAKDDPIHAVPPITKETSHDPA